MVSASGAGAQFSPNCIAHFQSFGIFITSCADYPGMTLQQQKRSTGLLESGAVPEACASRWLRAIGLLHRRNILPPGYAPPATCIWVKRHARLLDFRTGVSAPACRTARCGPSGHAQLYSPEDLYRAEPSAQQDLIRRGCQPVLPADPATIPTVRIESGSASAAWSAHPAQSVSAGSARLGDAACSKRWGNRPRPNA